MIIKGAEMNIEIVDAYLKHAQHLSCRLNQEPSALQELLHSIELGKDAISGESHLEEFFKGEYAFYSASYERALKHYLEAKNVDKFEFFCYRATAFVLKGQGQYDKAIDFAKRALDILPDYPTLHLLSEIFSKLGRHHEADEALLKARILNESTSTIHLEDFSSKISAHQVKKISIGEKEIQELATIFLNSPTEEGLFSADTVSNCHGNPIKNFPEMKLTTCSFQDLQKQLISDYIAKWKNRSSIFDHCLYVLQGWNEELKIPAKGEIALGLLTEEPLKSSGGFYIRWNGKGIVINPGKNFLKNFHRAGLHFKDIHSIICTHADFSIFEDIKEIYDLAFKMNKFGEDLQIIHYYLHPKAFHHLSGILKPHFKQERHAIHCLDWMDGSQEMERVELAPGICLHYFSCEKEETHPTLFIKLELTPVGNSSINRTFNFGYLPAYTSLKDVNVGHCDILLKGIGAPNDTQDMTRSIKSVSPKLVLCAEFDGFAGDLRLEIIRQLREELGETTILPADNGLFLNLKSLSVKGTYDDTFIDVSSVRTIRSAGAFSPLIYLSKQDVI